MVPLTWSKAIGSMHRLMQFASNRFFDRCFQFWLKGDSVTITRVGTNEKYSDGWNGIFGGKASKKVAKASPATDKAVKKKAAKKVAPVTKKPIESKKAAPKAPAPKSAKKAVVAKPIAAKTTAKPVAAKSAVKKAAKK